MTSRRQLIFFLICSFFSACTMFEVHMGAKATPEEKASEEKEEKDDYAKAIENKEKTEGMFTVFEDDDHMLWEIKPDLLNKTFVWLQTLETGLGDGRILTGLPIDHNAFTIERHKNTLQFKILSTVLTADPQSAEERILNESMSSSVMFNAKIKGTNPENGGMLIDMKPHLLSDHSNVTERLKSIFKTDYEFNKDQSRVSKIKVFEKNIEISVRHYFSTKKRVYSATVTDNRQIEVGLQYSLVWLEDNNYRPRIANQQIGYFNTNRYNLSKMSDRKANQLLINRWHLEKADPTAAVSVPKKPITFWISNTTPPQFRSAVKEGVLLWNKAFKKAGFKNAVEVKQQPDDCNWDPADIKYNMVRWVHHFDTPVAGIGPLIDNPLTGEIIAADIIIDGNAIVYRGDRYDLINRSDAPNGYAHENKITQCACSQGKAQQSHLAWEILDQQVGGEALKKQMFHETIVELAAHEIGHVLGLRHNFKGSLLHKPEDLNNKALVKEKGLSSSVMDYTSINIAAPGEKQGYFYSPSVGPYDIWAIQYGYTPFSIEDEKEGLEKIASWSDRRELDFGTDEDTYSATPDHNIDPHIAFWDMSSDPIAYKKIQLEVLQAHLDNIKKRTLKKGEDFDYLSNSFGRILQEQLWIWHSLTAFIGGEHFSRSHYRGSDSPAPIALVDTETQKKALSIIENQLLTDKNFNYDPNLLNMLVNPRDVTPATKWGDLLTLSRHPFQTIAEARKQCLKTLFGPTTLNQLKNISFKYQNTDDLLDMDYLFTSVTNNVFLKEINSSTSQLRRRLQIDYLDILKKLALNPGSDQPYDAKLMARHQLKSILEATLESTLESTRKSSSQNLSAIELAHWSNIADTITKTLEAEISQS